MKKIFIIFFVFSILLIFSSFFFSINQITGKGMEPAIKNKQLVVFRKYFFNSPYPKRGDIVLYYPKNTSSYSEHVGRVIGLPLESIMFKNGKFYLDNNHEIYRMEEEYLPKNFLTKQSKEDEWIKLSQFEYLVAKDLRQNQEIDVENSKIHRNNIKGVLFIKI